MLEAYERGESIYFNPKDFCLPPQPIADVPIPGSGPGAPGQWPRGADSPGVLAVAQGRRASKRIMSPESDIGDSVCHRHCHSDSDSDDESDAQDVESEQLLSQPEDAAALRLPDDHHDADFTVSYYAHRTVNRKSTDSAKLNLKGAGRVGRVSEPQAGRLSARAQAPPSKRLKSIESEAGCQ